MIITTYAQFDASQRGKKGLRSSLAAKMQGSNGSACAEGGIGSYYICDPGSELRLGAKKTNSEENTWNGTQKQNIKPTGGCSAGTPIHMCPIQREGAADAARQNPLYGDPDRAKDKGYVPSICFQPSPLV